MYVLKTVAHELAHYLYGTIDNTINHYTKESMIYNEILEMYVLNKDYVSDVIKYYS